MTREQNIEIIRKACIKANPDILKLEFGCVVATEKGTGIIVGENLHGVILSISDDSFPRETGFVRTETFLGVDSPEIIGRPIRLADVLLALQKLADDDESRHWCVNRWGEFVKELVPPIPYHGVEVGEKWDLHNDNLDSQSDETLEFLVNILK